MTEWELLLLIEEKIGKDAAKAFVNILSESRRHSNEKGWRQCALPPLPTDADMQRLMEGLIEDNPHKEKR